MVLRRPRMVLIDLDGTLVDSVPDLAFCIDETMIALDMPRRGEQAVRQWVGNGVQRLVERALVNDVDGVPEQALYDRALPIFMQLYERNTSKRSRLYDGVIEGLDYLRGSGFRLACVTNKPEQFTLPLLSEQGLDGYFELVVSGDSLPKKKPDPLPLLHAAERLGFDPHECLMVGDSKSDVQAARAAGFQIVCMSYGYNHGQDIRDSGPDAVIDSMTELRALLEEAA